MWSDNGIKFEPTGVLTVGTVSSGTVAVGQTIVINSITYTIIGQDISNVNKWYLDRSVNSSATSFTLYGSNLYGLLSISGNPTGLTTNMRN
jgi:translation initiation factor 6 (eIF-6)